MRQIGALIRILRTEKGYTQEGLADLLELSTSGLAKIERGESDFSLMKLEKIASFFNLSVVAFLQMSYAPLSMFTAEKETCTDQASCAELRRSVQELRTRLAEVEQSLMEVKKNGRPE